MAIISPKLLSLCVLLAATAAQAHERPGPSGDSGEKVPSGPPCAVVEKFGGDLQILDATRTRLEDPRRGLAIGCGGWVSVTKGWVQLKHQGGALIRLGSGSFARLKDEADQVILHRGEAHLTAGRGRGAIRVITPNARASIQKGTAILIYNTEEEETQLIALEDTAKLENRFEGSRPVQVKAGEGTSLNFRLLRVVPSAPRAVSIAAIRRHLSDLKLEGRTRETAVTSVQKRLDRRFAATHKYDEDAPQRAPTGNYARHPASVDDEFVRRTMARKVAGDERGGGAVLHPHGGQAGSPDVAVDRLGAEEAAEKHRLIEELSKIKEEE